MSRDGTRGSRAAREVDDEVGVAGEFGEFGPSTRASAAAACGVKRSGLLRRALSAASTSSMRTAFLWPAQAPELEL
jgi:hypothetical protein